jgi:hypothetical protein
LKGRKKLQHTEGEGEREWEGKEEKEEKREGNRNTILSSLYI